MAGERGLAHMVNLIKGMCTLDVDCAGIVRRFREESPKMKRITLENECEVGGMSMEEAREKEIEYCVKTINYLRDELGLGMRGR